ANGGPPLTTLTTRWVLPPRPRTADCSASCPRPRPCRPPRSPPWRPPRALLLLVLSSRRPEAAGPLFRCCAAIFRSSSRPVSGRRSQRQAGLASAVGDGGHAAVVLVAAAVEHDGVDPGGLRTLADQGPDGASLVRLAAVRAAQVRLPGRGRREGPAQAVVDDLHEDVARRAGDHQTGALGGADDAATDPQVTPAARAQLAAAVALGVLECVTHDHLPAFPALRTTVSSAYRTPLPL